jgi:hypothetical protein
MIVRKQLFPRTRAIIAGTLFTASLLSACASDRETEVDSSGATVDSSGSAADQTDAVITANGAIVRDSAGVTLIENPPALDGERNTWTVPAVAIGAVDGAPAELFSMVRDVALRPDGSIVVVDGASNEVRFFGPAGDHLFTRGGAGDGPGQFRHATSIVGLRGESVLIHDQFRARITVFASEGSVTRTIELTAIHGFLPAMAPLGLTRDGRVWIRGVAGPPPAGVGPVVIDAPLFIADLDDLRMERIADVPFAIGATGSEGSPVSIIPIIVPVHAPSDSGLWTLTATVPEMRKVRPDGSLERIIRMGPSPELLTSAEEQRIRAWYRERVGASSATPEILREVPAFARVIVDVLDHLWVQEVSDARDPETWEFGAPRGGLRWKVLDPFGVIVGTVTVPPGFQPLAVGADYLLGVWTDETDVEFVHLYDLQRR